MRKLTFGMNLSLDGYIAASGDDLGWSVPSDELFQWWSDRVGATGLALYGRKLWQTMSSHWPTADQRRDQSEGAACPRVCARKLDDDALAGGASVRVRNGVLVNAATVTREGR